MHGACVARRRRAATRPACAGCSTRWPRWRCGARRRFIAWEYVFHFGGGSPPWMSGMAQATGIQALRPRVAAARRAATTWTSRAAAWAPSRRRPPRGVRTAGPAGGVHYLQYSFAPRLYIFNAFLQSLIGLHDYGRSPTTRAPESCTRQAEPEAREEVPLSDVGDWSRYSYRGAESTRDYHELLREFLASMCTRRLGAALLRLRRALPRLPGRPARARPTPARSAPPRAARPRSASRCPSSRRWRSRCSAATRSCSRRLATFRRGAGAFSWRPARPGLY